MNSSIPPKNPPANETAARSRRLSTTPAPPAASPPPSVAPRAAPDRQPYLRLAFANPYNLSLFAGSLAVAAIAQQPLLALTSLGAEALWLVFGPDSKLLRRLLWDPALDRKRRDDEARARARALLALPLPERQRVESLVRRREDIRSLAAQNPSFTGELVRSELSKTDRLVDAFVEMALNCARYEQYLQSIDVSEMEKDRDRYRRAVRAGAEDDRQTQIARKNIEIVEKRLERIEEIRHYLSVARGQLDLIDNSFRLLGDQIVTMESPKELSGQLDDLLDGVEAIRETARDTERILGTMDKEM